MKDRGVISGLAAVGIIGVIAFLPSVIAISADNRIVNSPRMSSDPALIISDSRTVLSPMDNVDEDWTVECGAAILASIAIADVNSNGEQDILVTTYGLPPNPYWSGYLRIYDPRGNLLPGWPQMFSGAMPGTPAVGDVDNDGDAEIVVGTWVQLHVLDAGGTELPGWPLSADVTEAVALWDLDNDGDLEIVVPVEQSMRIYHHNGSMYSGWPTYAPQSLTAAAIADLNGDDIPEIVAGTYIASGSATGEVYVWDRDGNIMSGWPFQTAGSVKAPPAVGDVDGDGEPEIVVGAWNQSAGTLDPLYVLNANGQIEPGWPRAVSYNRLSSPSLGDLDGDGALEIVVGGLQPTPTYQNEVFVLRGNGANFPGWPVAMTLSPAGNINSSPIIGDIDDDNDPEIIVKVINYIVAFDITGAMVPGFPILLGDGGYSGTFSPSPAVGDFDRDGDADLVAAACYSTISFYDFPGSYCSESALWTQYRHDSLNTGSALPDTIISAIKPSPQPLWNGNSREMAIYPNPTSGIVHISLPVGKNSPVHGTLFNVLGQKVAEFNGISDQSGIATSFLCEDKSLTPGVYFLKIGSGGDYHIHKIAIQP